MNFPDLSKEDYLVVDVETDDPGLTKLGTNAIHRARGGQLLGFGVYAPGGFNDYYQYERGNAAAQWLRDQLRLSKKVIGANTKYDLLWLLGENLWDKSLAKRRYGDVLINATLLNENDTHSHNLNGQAAMYGLPAKRNGELFEAGKQIGLKTENQIKNNMALLQEHFPDVVAAYGKHDCFLTGKLWEAQQPFLLAEGLTEAPADRPHAMPVVELEERFLPILVLMEAHGIRVDLDAAKGLQDKLIIGINEEKALIKEHAGYDINYNPSNILRDYIEKHCPGAKRGGKKNDICTGYDDIVRFSDDPVIAAVLAARKLGDKISTIKGSFIDQQVEGRIYPNIWQLTSENEHTKKKAGTTTGRQSYSLPNLQNIPSPDKDKVWGPLMRQLIIADEGCEMVSLDFSQQEPRWSITWAVMWNMPGALEAAQEFINNPDADWHGMVAEFLGGPQYRAAGKQLVLARTYCQGQALCRSNMLAAGVPEENIAPAIAVFDAKMGFLKAASKAADNQATKRGYVRTWSGRKRRFDLWVPKTSWDDPRTFKPLSREEAHEVYFQGLKMPIVRHETYKAFNAIVQGSSADQTKQCTIQAFYEDDLVPDLEVHDEIVDGKIDNHDIIERYKHHMINTIKLAVPNRVGIKVGKHWLK